MMKAAIAILVLALLVVLGYCLFGKKATPPVVVPEPVQVDDRGVSAKDAAEKMVALLPQLIDSRTFSRMGFRSQEEVKEAKAGLPIPLIRLRCDTLAMPDSLRKPAAPWNDDLEPLSFAKQWMYPVLVKESIRTSVIVDSIPDPKGESKADWLAVEAGNPGLVRLVDSSVQSHSKISGIAASAYSVVEIPALGQWFLAYAGKEGPMMVALNIKTPFGCMVGKPGEAMRVSAVLGALQKCPETAKVCRVMKWEKAAEHAKSRASAK